MQRFDLGSVMHIHLIGIGGSGMGGIAEVLLNQGYKISGSDISQNRVTEHLQDIGATIYLGHQADQVEGADVIVVSSAIEADNPEVKAALDKRIPIIRRAQMLSEIMRSYYGIAVAGTHGKTTTTSLIATALTEGGLDPTYVIGGLLKGAGSHANLGEGRYFVAEADESDASFLYLHPRTAVVTNIDSDHLSAYEGDFEKLKTTFIQFLDHLPFNGLAVMCIDDTVVADIISHVNKPILTYGFNSRADIHASDFEQVGTVSHFKIHNTKTNITLDAQLNLPGEHNVLNALAAYAVAFSLGVSDGAILSAFASFSGVGRRFQVLGEFRVPSGNVLMVDDYGHHPSEVVATIAAARAAWPDKRLVMAYQPHRFTRTQELWDDFVNVLSSVDGLMLLDIYGAGEDRIPGITGKNLAKAIQEHGSVEPVFVEHLYDLSLVFETVLRDGDVLLMQGAGNIGALTAKLSEQIGVTSNSKADAISR